MQQGSQHYTDSRLEGRKSEHILTITVVICLDLDDKIDTLLEDRIGVLILKPGYEVDGNLQQNIHLSGCIFELQVIVTNKIHQ